ncbi:MAG: alkaline phosphatase family protein [Verrucomicrobiota bacterium]|nr:alkaline phosphatase family protein [Verrucomicrobiota bacterium]
MATPLAKRILLIGWDAADWTFLSPLLDAGKMPNLQRVVESGTSGRIATLQPILSPILWTSVATGKRGDKHGVLSFVEPKPAGDGIQPVSSYSRKAKALWNILSQHDRSSVIVNWYASHPAEKIRGAIVSNRFSEAALAGRPADPSAFHPADLAEVMEKLRTEPAKLHPAQMVPFFLDAFPADDDSRLQALAKLMAQTVSVHNAATYLAEAEEWDFLAVYYDMIDHVGHGFAEYVPPRLPHVPEEDFKIFQHVVESTYRFHDLMLGRWLELAGEDTTVIVLSDHGFYLNRGRPMAERGWIEGEPRPGVNINPLMWHRMHGLFAASGPAIRRDSLVHSATLLDIAPTILALLGLPVPDDFEGRVLTQIFNKPCAIEHLASYEPPHPNDGVHRGAAPEEEDPWAAQAALTQLAELGYIEAPSDDVAKGQRDAIQARESHLAQIHFAAGRYAEALALLEGLAARTRNPSYSCRCAMCYIALRDPEKAEEILQRTVAQVPHYGLARMLIAQTAVLRGKMEEARELFQALAETETQMPALHNQLGVICLRQQLWKEAAEFFQRALASDPDMADAHDGLGVALRNLGQYEDSVFEHMRAVSLQHDRAQTHVNLGISLVRTRKMNWAIRAFEVAAELAPNEPYPHRCLARIYRRMLPDREKAAHHLLRARDLRRRLRGTTPAFRQGA